MKKNIFDKMSDSYEDFHFKDTELHVRNNTLYISPRIKLILGWSLFILCCVLAYAFIGNPFAKKQNKGIEIDKRQEVMEKDVDVKEEHDTMIPYEKDDDEELNNFIYAYFNSEPFMDFLNSLSRSLIFQKASFLSFSGDSVRNTYELYMSPFQEPLPTTLSTQPIAYEISPHAIP